VLDGMKMSLLRAEAAQARYLNGGAAADRAQRDRALAAFGAAMRRLDPAQLDRSGHAARFNLLQQHALRHLAEWGAAAAAAVPTNPRKLHRATALLHQDLDAAAQDLAAREAQRLHGLRAEGRLWERYADTGFALQAGALAVALCLLGVAAKLVRRAGAVQATLGQHLQQRSVELAQANAQLNSARLWRAQAEQQLQASNRRRRHLLAQRARIAEEERKRISRDMHDGLGQDLFALKLALARLHAGSGQPRLHAETGQLLGQVDDVIGHLRAIIHDLRPAALERGLDAAVRRQAELFRRRAGRRCRLDLHLEPVAVDEAAARVVFRMLQEALSNILRHAGATRVWVELVQSGDTLRLAVRDNGCGFQMGADAVPADAACSAFGLAGMRERARACGARLEIDSAPGHGTALALALPLRQR
jgi:signal transduction histidine kinase